MMDNRSSSSMTQETGGSSPDPLEELRQRYRALLTQYFDVVSDKPLQPVLFAYRPDGRRVGITDDEGNALQLKPDVTLPDTRNSVLNQVYDMNQRLWGANGANEDAPVEEPVATTPYLHTTSYSAPLESGQVRRSTGVNDWRENGKAEYRSLVQYFDLAKDDAHASRYNGIVLRNIDGKPVIAKNPLLIPAFYHTVNALWHTEKSATTPMPSQNMQKPAAILEKQPQQSSHSNGMTTKQFTANEWMSRIGNAVSMPTDPYRIYQSMKKAQSGDWEEATALLLGGLPAFFERLPDYITISGALPVGTPFTGWSGTATYDLRNKKFYFSPAGAGAAFPAMAGLTITGGWYGTFSKETATKELPSFLSKHGINAQISYGPALGYSYGFGGHAVEAGFGAKGISLTYNYTWSEDDWKQFWNWMKKSHRDGGDPPHQMSPTSPAELYQQRAR